MSPREWEPAAGAADERPTFLSHALALSALHGPGPWPRDGHPLPDEPADPAARPVLPSVVMDGVRSRHRAAGPRDRAEPPGGPVTDIADRVTALAAGPPGPLGPPGGEATAALHALHARLAGQDAIAVADDLVAELERRRLPRERVRAVARHLTEHGTRRGGVKLGLVLLGVSGDERDRELLLLLGALGELTLYAVVALRRTQPDRYRVTYELARRVHGWGRIHAVERLAGCTDPEVKGWLLREGFRNGVMDEYLAHIAATTGDLYGALLEPEVDEALLDGTGGILAALATGGPAEDMRDYAEAVPALRRYGELAATMEPGIGRLGDLLTVAGFLRRADAEFPWPDGEPDRLLARYRAVLDRPVWRRLVRARLADPVGEYGFNLALSCAGRLGVPALPQALAHLEGDPYNAYVWQWAVRRAGPEAIGAVTALAERLLPLAELAAGPGDRPGDGLGLGPRFAADTALEIVVSGLGDHPGAGAALVRAALTNRVTRARRAAQQALAAWPARSRPYGWRGWVGAAAEAEPHGELRAALRSLLGTGGPDREPGPGPHH